MARTRFTFAHVVAAALCAVPIACREPSREKTALTCQDGEDGDGDGLVDCADTDCQGFDFCDVADSGIPGTCGDALVDPGEECDDGVLNSDEIPDRCRLDCSAPACGDGVVDLGAGEACDAGPANSDTTPDACRTDCSEPACGDGVADVDHGEHCDGSDEPYSCADFGLPGPAPALCDPSTCTVDPAPCGCGNGYVEPSDGEECDSSASGAPLLGGATCATVGFPSAAAGVLPGCGSPGTPSACLLDALPCTVVAICGNGTAEPGEACDGADLGGASCATLGFDGGPLACSPACAHDTTACLSPPPPTGFGGDLNGDGYDDMVIGAWGYAGPADQGVVYVFLGGPGGPDGSAESTLVGAAPNDGFGLAVRIAGDLNADGFADLVVGAMGADSGGLTNSGSAYVFLGGAGTLFDSGPDAILTAPAPFDQESFGRTVSAGGDLDGDAIHDVVVGADIYLRTFFFGGGSGSSFDPGVDAILSAFGDGVNVVPDADGDALADLLIAEPQCGVTGAGAGCVTLLSGASTLGGTPAVIQTFYGETADDSLGRCAAPAGDVNGDAFPDLVLGAALSDAVAMLAGRAYVYFGGPGGMDATPDAILDGAGAVDFFGIACGPAGDVDGDGFDDVLVGASQPGVGAGYARLYLGGPGGALDPTPDAVLVGEASGDAFGGNLWTAGDANGDGYADFLVGATDNDAGAVNGGRAYLYFGAASGTFDSVADVTFTGTDASGFFGTL